MGRKLVMAGGGQADFGDVVTKYWPVVAGLAVAAWALLRSWFSRRALSEHAKNELVTIAQNAAKGVIRILQDENDRLNARVDLLENDFGKLQTKHAEMMASKDAEITLLRGECREAMTLAMSYEHLLTENSIPHEQPIRPFWDVSGTDLRPIKVMS